MKLALCTISFRHQLISFRDLIRFASEQRFDGIEMWGVHADNLYEHARVSTAIELRSMVKEGLRISMLSDYLNITSQSEFQQTLDKCDHLIQLAQWFGTTRIRTFAGNTSSLHVTEAEREQYIARLSQLCDRCLQHGIQLVVEIHPNTLTDHMQSTSSMLTEIGNDRLRLNFDVLHAWEYGGNLIEHYEQLEPWVDYFHLKNVSNIHSVHVFEPNNVYAAAGSRTGMVPLGEGAIDYASLLPHIAHKDCYAALEWFGPAPSTVLKQEMEWLSHLTSEQAQQKDCVRHM